MAHAVPVAEQVRQQQFALVALIAGALAIGFAPIFVRVSEVGPVATAFWRVALAAPVLILLAQTRRRRPVPRNMRAAVWPTLFCGLMFAGDLSVWHYSINFTTVANATLLANMAPVFVVLSAWLLFGERISRQFLLGLVIAIVGAIVLTGTSLSIDARHVLGDVLGIVTAGFYAAYQLSVASLRRQFSAIEMMGWSSLATAVVLFFVALASGETLLPVTPAGWATFLGIALFSHAAGQTLIAYGFAHLPVAFSSVSLLIQPVAAAFLAWILLGETLSWFHLIGAVIVLAGIYLARRGSNSG